MLAVFAGFASAGPAFGQQLSLTFEGHGEYVFSAGYAIHVPESWILTSIRIDLNDQPEDRYTLQLNGQYLARGSQTSGIRAVSRNALGFLRLDSQHLTVLKGVDRQWEWLVTRATQPHVFANLSRSDGPAPDVRIDEPALLFIKGGVADVRIAGSVVSSGEFSVQIDGKEIQRDVTRDGWGFSELVRVTSETRSVEILVRERCGSAKRLLLPVIR